MGSGAGFAERNVYTYQCEDAAFGVKLLKRLNNSHNNNPRYANKSKMYAHRNDEGIVVQISVYENGVRVYDIDWGHAHDSFKKGEIHIQWCDKDGKRDPSRPAELPTKEQIELVNKVKERWNNGR